MSKNSTRADPETYKLSLALLDEQVAAVDKEYEKLLANLTKKANIARYELTAKIVPSDFKKIEHLVIEQSKWSIRRLPLPEAKEKPPVVTAKISKVLMNFVEKVQPQISIIPVTDLPLFLKCSENTASCEGPMNGGYPYRWPVVGKITLSIQVDSSGDNDGRVDVFSSHAAIAQFGPILRLPSKLAGSKGNLEVTYHAGQGSLKSVALGSTAVSLQPVAATGTAVQSVLEARGKRKDAKEAEEEAALAAQNDELKREVERLELLTKKRELEAPLGITENE